jgi:predicted kinase
MHPARRNLAPSGPRCSALGAFLDRPQCQLDHNSHMNCSGARLVIVCGLPGSGKTSLATQLEGKLQAVRFCPDEWMTALSLNLWDEERRAQIEALQWKLCRQLLTLGVIVIIEWGTWARSERDMLRIGARELGAAVELHYLEARPDALHDRIRRRALENPPITREAIQRWSEIFQAPTPEEMALFDEPLILPEHLRPA